MPRLFVTFAEESGTLRGNLTLQQKLQISFKGQFFVPMGEESKQAQPERSISEVPKSEEVKKM